MKMKPKKEKIPHKKCAKKTCLMLFKKLEGREDSAGYAWLLIRNVLKRMGEKV